MSSPYQPSLWDDVVDLSTIAVASLVAFAITGRVLVSLASGSVSLAPMAPPPPPPVVVEVDPAAGADRVFGRVITSDGSEVAGYLRWNGVRVSWADRLPAVQPRTGATAGVRFGRVIDMEPVDDHTLRLTLKSGETVDFGVPPGSGGAGLSLLVVEEGGVGPVSIPWSSIEVVQLLREPEDRAPPSERIHGTLITRSGLGFTGYVTWDGDRAVLGDGLDSEEAERLSFSDVAAIRAEGPALLTVVLHSGEERTVRGEGTGGAPADIIVADPLLGSITVPWQRVRELRLHSSDVPTSYEDFDGSDVLQGTVLTRGKEGLEGRIRWDLDESQGWDMLDGEYEGVEFHVELDQVARVRKARWGADVELRDGRTIHMQASNDVSWRNRGIEIVSGGAPRIVEWADFVEMRLDRVR